MTMTIVEPIYKVLENNPDEWVIAKACDPVYIVKFPSEIEALVYATFFGASKAGFVMRTASQGQPALHPDKTPTASPWSEWPTEHLLRKIEMPEGFVAELRKRLGAATTLAKWCDEHGTENIPTSLMGEIIEIIAANPLGT